MAGDAWIVLINYNGLEDTRGCLRSIEAISQPASRIVVIDNASTEDPTPMLRAEFPRCHVSRSSVNGGWAGGNNAGIRLALDLGADWVVLLNNDTIVAPKLVDRLLAAAQAHPDYGILGPVICHMDEPEVVMTDGCRFNPPGFPGFFERIEVAPAPDGPPRVREVNIVNGCCMMVSAEVFRRVGLIDERFFLIHEESDLCLRAQRAGFRCGVLAEPLVWHKGSSSFRRSGNGLQRYYDARNLCLLLRNHLGAHDGRGTIGSWRAYAHYLYHRYCQEPKRAMSRRRTRWFAACATPWPDGMVHGPRSPDGRCRWCAGSSRRPGGAGGSGQGRRWSVRFLFVKHSLAWPRSSGHDVHCYHMMRTLAGLGHAVALVTVDEPAPEAIVGLPLVLCRAIGGERGAGAPSPLAGLRERFRSYWGIEPSRIAAVARAAENCDADAVVVVGLDVLPYLGAVEGARRVWYAGDEWAWHHLSQARPSSPSTWGELKAGGDQGAIRAGLRGRCWTGCGWSLRPTAGRCGWPWATTRIDVVPNGIDAGALPARRRERPGAAAELRVLGPAGFRAERPGTALVLPTGLAGGSARRPTRPVHDLRLPADRSGSGPGRPRRRRAGPGPAGPGRKSRGSRSWCCRSSAAGESRTSCWRRRPWPGRSCARPGRPTVSEAPGTCWSRPVRPATGRGS